jgi:hypothetical protein
MSKRADVYVKELDRHMEGKVVGKARQLKSGACWVKEGSADVPPQSLINKSQGGDLFTCSRVDGRLTVEVGINKSGYPVYYARFLNFLPQDSKSVIQS